MRGLKHAGEFVVNADGVVALLVSAWIETVTDEEIKIQLIGRTPRECVD